ncbi:hypothetical protein HY025_00595 [Candidatus Daviesbacteria bacterium]|nr:hypothetical protein [Candidatus Daviesbacteria bacterium]
MGKLVFLLILVIWFLVCLVIAQIMVAIFGFGKKKSKGQKISWNLGKNSTVIKLAVVIFAISAILLIKYYVFSGYIPGS